MLETFVCKGWSNDVGPQCVLQEAQARVEKDGWDKTPSGAPATFLGVRKAISTKVQYVINNSSIGTSFNTV